MGADEQDNNEHARTVRRRWGIVVALTGFAAYALRRVFARRRNRVTAESIAAELFAAGLDGEELFDAMWDWHDRTGIETRDMFAHYKTLTR